jgi:hypothetical protein
VGQVASDGEDGGLILIVRYGAACTAAVREQSRRALN